MTSRSKILDAMRNLRPFNEIKAEFRSQSGIYEGLRVVLAEKGEELRKKEEALQEIDGKLACERAELELVVNEKRQLACDVEEQKRIKTKVIDEVASKMEELGRLQAGLSELRSRGIDEKLLEDVRAIECRSGSGLLAELRNCEKRKDLKKQVAGLTDRRAYLEKEIGSLSGQKVAFNEEIRCEKNRLDQLMVETAIYKDAVEVVKSFFAEGYGPEELAGLRGAIDLFGIRQDPNLTFKRIVDGLRSQKTLFTLEQKVTETENRLAALRQAKTETETNLNVTKEALLRTLQDVTSAALKLKTEQEWNEFSPFLSNQLESTEKLKTASPFVVLKLLERISFWIHLNLPNASAKPSPKVVSMDNNLFLFADYKVEALIEFVIEHLRTAILRSNSAG